MVGTSVAQRRIMFSERGRSYSSESENQYEYQHFTVNNRTGSVRAKRQVRNTFSNLVGLLPTDGITPAAMENNSNNEEPSKTLKILLIGDAAVGKTSTLLRFKDNRFEGGSHMGTVGIDYRNKVVKLDDEVIKLQIWDTAGQERFRSITHAYYRDAHALLLLYEVSNRTTFDNTRAWLAEIYEYASPSICIMLIGNKCDSERREVAKEDGKRLADEYGIEFLETSAKTGYNVDVAFKSVARRLLQTKDQAPQFYRQRKSILEPRQPTTQSCTCG